jgi:hypothetical protein
VSFEDDVMGAAAARAAERFAERADKERTHHLRRGDIYPLKRLTPEEADEIVPCAYVGHVLIVGIPAEALT